MATKRPVFGTKEWASHNVNCTTGCVHDCRYCYAKYNAINRFHTVKPGQWTNESIDFSAIERDYPKYDGTVMFPTTHDITPEMEIDGIYRPGNFEACIIVLWKLLSKGNNVLIVMKPHYSCVRRMVRLFTKFKSQILFRFTICASDNSILKYWEPNGPSFEERMMSLKLAYERGFQTSISMEPCLDWPNVVANFDLMAPYVTNSIWIGTLNFIDQRVEVETEKDREMVAQMKSWMTQETFQKVYDALKDHPLIKWKESMKKALGLPEVEEVGKDI